MTDMSVADIDAALVELRTALRQRLTGGQRTKIAYAGGSVEKSVGSVEDIRMEIARLEMLRRRLTGGAGGGPIRIGFGGRV